MPAPVTMPKKKGFPRPWGRYTLEKSLSRGGMGEVFLAIPRGIDQRCVIKTIRSDLTGDKEFIGRFADEAKIMMRIAHPNIIRIFDCGKVGRDYYIAMEYAYGRDLGDVLDRAYERGEPLPTDLGLYLTKQLLKGLDYIHNVKAKDGRAMGLVHRDISPQNVLIGFDASIKLIDFGLAKTELLPARTQGALAVGKYGYMSPEQARHEKIDGRADIYSLGVMLFEVFTGDRLVDEQDQATLWARVLNPKHRRPSAVVPTLPKEVDEMIMRAVGVKPKDRYGSAMEWLKQTDSYKTKPCDEKRLIEYLRYLYPRVEFSQPAIPKFDNVASDGEKSMIIAMSEANAKSVFGRGKLPVQFTQMVNMNNMLPELERRRAEDSKSERTVAGESPTAGATRAGEPQMLVTDESSVEAELAMPEQETAGYAPQTVGSPAKTVRSSEGPLPAGILADNEETAYARPPPGARVEASSATKRAPVVQVSEKFRDEEQTVMMDAPPPRSAQAAWAESITREEISPRPDADKTADVERPRGRTPAAPAAQRRRVIQERKRPGQRPNKDKNAVAMRATIGNKASANKAAPPKRKREEWRPTEDDTQPPDYRVDAVAPKWLLLGLILMGITIIILLLILILQKS